MHCAFAKYEQGFKRKNEYLERRRVKRREEVDRGVQHELKKRGANGELDDPLLASTVGPKNMEGSGHMDFGRIGDDSTIGLGGMGEDEESQSVRNYDAKRPAMQGIEDSELTNNIVGLGLDSKGKEKKKGDKSKDEKKKKDKDKKKKDKKDKKEKKKKHKESSEDEKEQKEKEPVKGSRSSNRLNKNPEDNTDLTSLS